MRKMILDESMSSGSDTVKSSGHFMQFNNRNPYSGDEGENLIIVSDEVPFIPNEAITRDVMYRMNQCKSASTFSEKRLQQEIARLRDMFEDIFDTYINEGGGEFIAGLLKSRIALVFRGRKETLVMNFTLFISHVRTDVVERLMDVLGKGLIRTTMTKGDVSILMDEVASTFALVLPEVLETRANRLLDEWTVPQPKIA